jgi:hypothetical protein
VGGGLDLTGSGYGPVAGSCECGDEPSGSCTTELVSFYWQEYGRKQSCGHSSGTHIDMLDYTTPQNGDTGLLGKVVFQGGILLH